MNDSNKINAYDLTDEEFNDEMKSSTENFPVENSFGQELYDANANRVISEDERSAMIKELEQKFVEVTEILRISRNDPNTRDTPKRIAKMFVNELFSGRFTTPPQNTVFPNRHNVDQLVISKGIEVMSVCSHHWQTISGQCAIGYIPDKHVIGVSKLSRIVDWFARRGQIQEELGEQIADFIDDLIKPKALGVVIEAKHYCMIARGVKGSETNSKMITSVMRGWLKDDITLKNEFMILIKNNM
ncbi:MAG: GTP cyclohydrolase I [Chlorobi bacterium]|nr:GTP cyclohydrolase I [Chlorobiota bacterium]